MAIFHYDNLARNLPDCYKKDTSSNNYKILEVERQANVALRETLESINNILDISNATGKVLDMYGKKYGQLRGNATDAQYRTLIRAKIARSLASGSYKDIIDALCFTFSCTPDELLIADGQSPASVYVQDIPLDTILKAGFSASQAEQIIKSTLPLGTTCESMLFEGTFEFGADEYELDENAGFSEAENGEYGGYLGYTSSSEIEGDLPI